MVVSNLQLEHNIRRRKEKKRASTHIVFLIIVIKVFSAPGSALANLQDSGLQLVHVPTGPFYEKSVAREV